MSSIVVVGGCIVDLISYVSRFPRPGETIGGYNFEKGCGGKGANQCVMAQKLGASTAMIAKLGTDNFGEEHLQNFKQRGINHDFISFSKSAQTSTAAIVVTSEGDNNIVYVPGAIMELSSEDIVAAENLISGCKVLLCTYECPQETLRTALSMAKKFGVKTVVNAAPTGDTPYYEELYPLADILCVNEIEAEDATGVHVKTLEDGESAMHKLMQKGCSTVILTLGAKGALLQTKGDPKPTHVSTSKVKAVDSTGAGDAFMGSFVYFLSEYPDLSLKVITERSCKIATMSVLRNGTQSSFPDKKEIPAELFLTT